MFWVSSQLFSNPAGAAGGILTVFKRGTQALVSAQLPLPLWLPGSRCPSLNLPSL